MSKAPDQLVWINIPIDAETAERLQNLSGHCGADPVSVASSLLHDILKDDEDAHFLSAAPPPTGTIFN